MIISTATPLPDGVAYTQQTQNIFQTFLKGYMKMLYNIKTSGHKTFLKKNVGL